jgi:toxin-antitoxin system PIN domain toxin
MSYSVDANLLLYATNKDCTEHEFARAFLEKCLRGTELWCIAWPTIMAYLRISTHPAIFESPLRPADAEQNIERLLRLRHVRAIGEQEGFWRVYQEVTADRTRPRQRCA